MNRRHILGIFTLLLLGGLFLNLYEREAMTIEEQTEPPPTIVTTADEKMDINKTLEKKKMPTRSVSSITSSEIRKLRNSFPDKGDVRTEVERNPHRTPESLVIFATNMGPLMEKAYKNDKDADVLIKALHDCATDDNVARSARALCVKNVDKIAKTHPQMKGRAEELRSDVSPEVLKLLEKRNSMMR